jgi:hypothetical protein
MLYGVAKKIIANLDKWVIKSDINIITIHYLMY